MTGGAKKKSAVPKSYSAFASFHHSEDRCFNNASKHTIHRGALNAYEYYICIMENYAGTTAEGKNNAARFVFTAHFLSY